MKKVIALCAIVGGLLIVAPNAGAWKCDKHPEKPNCTTTTVPTTVSTTVPDTTTTTSTTVPETTTTTTTTSTTVPVELAPPSTEIRLAG